MREFVTALGMLVLLGHAWGDEHMPLGYRGSIVQQVLEEVEGTASDEGNPGRKSPGLALLASAAIPGAGQLYVGKPKLAAVFIGLEILGWTLYISEDNKGKDLEKAYKRFADDNYVFSAQGSAAYDSLDPWTWGWLEFCDEFLEWPTYPDTFPEIRDDFRRNYERRSSDFYGQIDSENRYIYGWEDWNGFEDGPAEEPWKYFISSLRERYRDMRRKANNRLKRADYVLALPVVLRAVSATLALNMARAHNSGLELSERVSIRWRLDWPDIDPAAKLALVVRY